MDEGAGVGVRAGGVDVEAVVAHFEHGREEVCTVRSRAVRQVQQ